MSLTFAASITIFFVALDQLANAQEQKSSDKTLSW
jgi:hypothetical protein